MTINIKLIEMTIFKILLIVFLLGAQSIALMAWEIHPAKKVYAIYRDDRETDNPVNIIARVSISASAGNLNAGSLIIDLAPNITHGDIIRASDILSIIPSVSTLCGRDYPDQPIASFSIDIRNIKDLWDEYRESILQNLNDAPGKIEFKSGWFQQKSLIFIRSNQKIAAIQKNIEKNVKTLANSVVVIPSEIHFAREVIGLDWDTIGKNPGLNIVSPPVVSFISKK